MDKYDSDTLLAEITKSKSNPSPSKNDFVTRSLHQNTKMGHVMI